MMCGMPKPQPRRRGEILKDVLIVADHPTWLKFNEVALRKGTTRSAMIRRYIRWEVKRAQHREKK